MRREQLYELISGTADPAFVLDPNGMIAAWNGAASTFFGISEENAIGNPCGEILRGIDECGKSCGTNCGVKDHARNCVPLKSYDIEVNTASGRKWCNMSVLVPASNGPASGYSIHIARSADLQKRFEHLIRDFVVSETSLPTANVKEMMSAKASTTQYSELSKREIEVLKLLADGSKTAAIAKTLFISPTTVNNHVQTILKKLSAHTRLEAVRRAEKAGLI